MLKVLLSTCPVEQVTAQSPLWQWAMNATGDSTGGQEGNSIATDRSGNVYITGSYAGSMKFGSVVLPPQNSCVTCFNAFLAKSDASGHPVWAIATNGVGFDIGNSVTTDAQNNVYFTGIFSSDSLSLGSITITNQGMYTFFIAKCDSNGNVLWLKESTSDSAGSAGGVGITTDGAGGVYVLGQYQDTVTFGSTTFPGSINYHLFLVKYDTSGNVVWASAAGWDLTGATFAYGIAADTSGIYITGDFGDSIRFGSINLYGANGSFFIAKYDGSGNALWAETSAGIGNVGNSLATDGLGNVYVTGIATDSIILGNISLLPLPGDMEFFIAKYNSSGQVLWGRQASAQYINTYSIAADMFGHVCVSGFSQDTSFVYDGTTFSLQNTYYHDQMFLLMLDTSGNLVCGTTLKDGGDDQNGLAFDLHGNAFLGGDYLIDSFIIGSDTLYNPNLGAELIFLAKFTSSACSPVNISSAGPTTICAGDSTQICAPGGFTGYNWNSGETTPCIFAKAAGNYYVSVTESGNCDVESNHIEITAHPLPPVSISVNGDTLRVYDFNNVQWFKNGTAITGAMQLTYLATATGNYTVQVTDSNGCSSISNPVEITRVKDIANDEISVYPNPTDKAWQLSVQSDWIGTEAEVFDERGRQVYKSEIRNLKSEIATEIAPGVYLLRIHSSTNSFVRKLVKM